MPPLVKENSETGEEELVPDYPAIGRLYAEAIASGRLPTNKLIVAAGARYLRMLEMAEDPKNDFYFSPAHVVDYCEFAEKLKHFESGNWEVNQIDAEGNVDPSIILEPFEIWMECAIQGFRRRSNGTRLVDTALECIPRKQAKSLRSARAALYELCCGGGLAPEIPIAAASARQADDTLFGDIVKMVNSDEELKLHYGLRVVRDEVTRGEGRIFPLAGAGEKNDGLNPSLALFEEGHAGAADVYRVVDSAFGARPNALRRMITTAGWRPEGPAYELIKQAELILLGKQEDYSFFAAIYTLDREDYTDPETNAIDWERLLTDESLIAKCNPMLGVSLDPVKIKNSVRQAFRLRPDLRGEVARTRFNIWTGAGTSLIEAAAWAACKRNISIEDFWGERCWIGVDLAQVLDMCAVILLFELATGELAVFGRFYLPAGSPTALNPELVDHLALWEEQGHLVLTEGVLADHDRVRADIEMFCEAFKVQVIACDPHQAHNTVRHLWDGNKPVMVYPNRRDTMTGPLDDLLGRIAAQTIIHDGNPVLAWMMGNVHGERRGDGTIMPRKEKENSMRKIDGVVATCFANGVRMQPEFAKPSGPEAEAPAVVPRVVGFDEIFGET